MAENEIVQKLKAAIEAQKKTLETARALGTELKHVRAEEEVQESARSTSGVTRPSS